MKAIKHSHYEQYLRLSNDDAALLVSSGRWVFVSKFEARKAIERQRPHRSVLARIGMFAAAALAVIALLVLSTSARAADKPVPYKVCLSQAQAAQVYPGKHLKYREVGKERCWYAGKTLPKHAFHSRAGAKQTLASSTKPFASQGSAAQVLNREFDSLDGSQFAHPVGTAVSLPRLDTENAPRVEGQSSSILEVSAVRRTDFTVTLEDDAVLALAGRPESWFTFDAYWDRMTGWQR